MKDHQDASMEMGLFGELVNALDRKRGSDGDVGAIFPISDAKDLRNGARHVPDAVTDARRAGQKVQFVQTCDHESSWYWEMPDGSQVPHGDFS